MPRLDTSPDFRQRFRSVEPTLFLCGAQPAQYAVELIWFQMLLDIATVLLDQPLQSLMVVSEGHANQQEDFCLLKKADYRPLELDQPVLY